MKGSSWPVALTHQEDPGQEFLQPASPKQLAYMVLSVEQCPLKVPLVCPKILEAQFFWPGLRRGL